MRYEPRHGAADGTDQDAKGQLTGEEANRQADEEDDDAQCRTYQASLCGGRELT